MIRTVQIFLLSLGMNYFAVERIGLFSSKSPETIEVLHSIPFLLCASLFFIVTFVQTVRSAAMNTLRKWMCCLSIALVFSGPWLSYFTRFHAEAVITEGQNLSRGNIEYVSGSLYTGRLAQEPDLNIRLVKLIPQFREDYGRIKRLKGKVRFVSADGGNPRERMFTDRLPRWVGGFWIKLSGFGYSPRYVLTSKDGKILDSSFVYMNLFPPGNEGYFRLLSPLTYYLRYYPSGKDGKGEAVYRLRIARNKDLLVNQDVRPGEEIAFENGILSFPEVRMWTKLYIKRDWGEIGALIGILLGVVALLSKKRNIKPRMSTNRD